jgi:hypothetical protein
MLTDSRLRDFFYDQIGKVNLRKTKDIKDNLKG